LLRRGRHHLRRDQHGGLSRHAFKLVPKGTCTTISNDAGFLNDLLPLPYTKRTLDRVAAHVDQVQEAVGRQMLLENPSTYVAFAESTCSEVDFIREVVRRTGCALLLDVNNVHVAATNLNYDPLGYIEAFPMDHVQEIHLGGHTREADEKGRPLLIDTHDRSVDAAVWDLFAHAVRRTGPLPTLIEWDADVPDWASLQAEARSAEAVMYHVAREPGFPGRINKSRSAA
jgi:uncharacterized protein